MKKFNIQSILLFSFSLVSLIVFISGIRELVVLNNIQEQKRITKILSETDILLKENTILLIAENQTLQRIINTGNEKEFNALLSEHEKNSLKEKNNFQNILSVQNEYNKILQTDDLTKTQELTNEIELFYSGNYLSGYKTITEQKERLINLDNYYLEKITEDKIQSKSQLKKQLESEIFDIQNQLTGTFKTIYSKIQQAYLNNAKLQLAQNQSVDKSYRLAQNITFVFFITVILILILVLVFLLKMIPEPVNKIQKQLNLITKGELPEKIELKAGDDINKIAETINRIVAGLKRLVDFSSEIGNANFETEYKLLGENDALGTSLLTLRENLQTAQEEDEKRKKEDAQRNRTNEGLTLFNEIMRQQSGSITELADVIISALVKFLNANQGGLFFLNEEDKENIHYELLGAYAYNRKKFLSKQIKPGEGLVGAVALEKYTIYMTDVPDEYVEIESGVGSANPGSILIVPLKIDENVLGVIELASFNKIEKYEVEMVEKIAESIASSMTNARINMQTSSLLKQSKDQESFVLEQEQEISQYIQEIKTLTRQVNTLERENKNLKEK